MGHRTLGNCLRSLMTVGLKFPQETQRAQLLLHLVWTRTWSEGDKDDHERTRPAAAEKSFSAGMGDCTLQGKRWTPCGDNGDSGPAETLQGRGLEGGQHPPLSCAEADEVLPGPGITSGFRDTDPCSHS